MPASLKSFELPEGYRPALGDSLQDFLKMNGDAPVAISLAALRRVDTLVVQLLLIAAQDWRRRGLSLRVTGVRSDFEESLQQLGVTMDLLDREVTA